MSTRDIIKRQRDLCESPRFIDRLHAVVLGEFVDGERRLEVGRTCKQLKPAVPIVVLYRMSGFRVTPDIADEQVELLDDPQFLLDAIGRVLMRKHGSS